MAHIALTPQIIHAVMMDACHAHARKHKRSVWTEADVDAGTDAAAPLWAAYDRAMGLQHAD